MNDLQIKQVLITKINKSKWWHVPPQDPDAYQKRGKFLASTYHQAEFYGRPNIEPEKAYIQNPVFGFSETEILKILFTKEELPQILDTITALNISLDYKQRISLDRNIAIKGKQLGFDSIVLMQNEGKQSLMKNRKPSSIELNLISSVQL